jgi:hypothetical protein
MKPLKSPYNKLVPPQAKLAADYTTPHPTRIRSTPASKALAFIKKKD